ncbi:MAG: hypothetical protein AAGK14_02665 [Verrucomicrobiota bacterium]
MQRWPRLLRPLGALAVVLLAGPATLLAQDDPASEQRDLVGEAAAHTALLDLRGDELAILNPAPPSWVRALEPLEESVLPLDTPHGLLIELGETVSVGPGVQMQVLLRSGGTVRINALSASFQRVMPEVAWELEGNGLASRTETLRAEGIRYLIVSGGDPDTLHTMLLSVLGNQRVLKALDTDYGDAPGSMFQRGYAGALRYRDQELFGRIRAELMNGSERLTARDVIEFEIQPEELPLLTVLAFQVRGIDPASHLLVDVNGRGPLLVHYTLPDLADPGYVGRLRPGGDRMSFQYLEPVHAKAVIPEDWLRLEASNTLRIYLPDEHPGVDISEVQLELKYPWSKFTYTLEP